LSAARRWPKLDLHGFGEPDAKSPSRPAALVDEQAVEGWVVEDPEQVGGGTRVEAWAKGAGFLEVADDARGRVPAFAAQALP
jgi:hypothetical protein